MTDRTESTPRETAIDAMLDALRQRGIMLTREGTTPAMSAALDAALAVLGLALVEREGATDLVMTGGGRDLVNRVAALEARPAWAEDHRVILRYLIRWMMSDRREPSEWQEVMSAARRAFPENPDAG